MIVSHCIGRDIGNVLFLICHVQTSCGKNVLLIYFTIPVPFLLIPFSLFIPVPSLHCYCSPAPFAKPFFCALGWSRTGAGCDAAADRLKAPVLRQRALLPYVPLRFHPSESMSARTQPAPARNHPKAQKPLWNGVLPAHEKKLCKISFFPLTDLLKDV